MRMLPFVVLHVSAGFAAILSGFVSIAFRKGSRGHRLAGNIFFVSMLIMSGLGALMAFFLFQFQNAQLQIPNIFGGVFTLYLVATGWWAARRAERATYLFDWVALFAASALCACFAILGSQALRSPDRLKFGYAPAFYFTFLLIVSFLATSDIRMLLRGGVSGTQRLVRHLGRITFSFFVATASFFLGQQKVMPPSWRGAKILFVPPLLVLFLLLYWFIRTKFANTHKPRSLATSRTILHVTRSA